MGLPGILLTLGLLVWLAYRGWSVLLLAPAAALIAAAVSRSMPSATPMCVSLRSKALIPA
jgi:H+/gluconate symporter-like permease